jgi:hypothetical protein
MNLPEIQIVDVILTPDYFGRLTRYSVVVDRMPKYVYARGEKKTFGYNRSEQPLTAHDSGFYDFMEDRPGTTDAFAGRKFTIAIDDGSTLECNGQVWASFNPNPAEPVVQVGVATLDKLRECYCFFGGHISKAKLQAWLDVNTPSRNYRKYDPKNTVAWLDERVAENHYGDRPVSAARARKLKKRGVTIRKRGAVRTWCQWYERQKAKIEADLAADVAVAP